MAWTRGGSRRADAANPYLERRRRQRRRLRVARFVLLGVVIAVVIAGLSSAPGG